VKTPRTAKLPPFYTHVIAPSATTMSVRDLRRRRQDCHPRAQGGSLTTLCDLRSACRKSRPDCYDGDGWATPVIREFLHRVGCFEALPSFSCPRDKQN